MLMLNACVSNCSYNLLFRVTWLRERNISLDPAPSPPASDFYLLSPVLFTQ
jgi:hypothetical protein